MSFANLKKNRSSFLEKVTKEVEKLKTPSYGDDDRYWQPTVDKAKNGYAVIRFLPPKEGEDLPWARIWTHGFKGPTGQWYIENSLTTLGKEDPVAEENTKLWNSGEEGKKLVSAERKRRLSYIANIEVIEDPVNKEAEGKQFLYKFGSKIFDKIDEQMHPQQFPGAPPVDPVNPFDFWEGKNFKLLIREVAGYRNYDKSEFLETTPLRDNDKELEEIYENLYSLTDLVSEDKFKSYDQLKSRLELVLGKSVGGPKAKPVDSEFDSDEDQSPPWKEEKVAESKSTPEAEPEDDTPEPAKQDTSSSDEDDDDVAFFKKMLNEK
jgi:hypothetical protein